MRYNDYSVEEAITNLHVCLEMSYMRTGMKIFLEPDAFNRFWLELNGMNASGTIPAEDKNINIIKLATPVGYLIIEKDATLGLKETLE